ncbi:MAG: hypothetical protein AB7T01_10275 [Acidithiobacillus sp.]
MSNKINRRSCKYALPVFISLLLAGCAQGPLLHVDLRTQQSYPPSTVVETLKAAPTRPYVVIAQMRAQAPAGTPGAQVLAALERKAAALGANAIIVQNHSQQTVSTLQFNPAGGNYENAPAQIIPIYDATAIRWRNAAADQNPSH